jgi:hypothetical protein
MRLKEAQTRKGHNIALLVEPPSLSMTHYDTAHALRGHFDVILTPWAGAVEWYGSPFVHYCLGGSWIRPQEWGPRDKTETVSLIVSEKQAAYGHQLRHRVLDLLQHKHRFDVWGRGVRPMSSKMDALGPYQYSIVIESIDLRGYFSEKLIDCLSVGTIPLYCGARDIDDYFPGLPTWTSLDGLDFLLTSPPSISDRVQLKWLHNAARYRCAEDWIVTNLEGVFND